MIDIEPIKKRLAAATPGPWRWMEDIFRHKYMERMKNGSWRAKPHKKAENSWLMLLTGPVHPSVQNFNQDGINNGFPDEYDFPHIIAIRWGDLKKKSIFNATPRRHDAEFISNAPIDIAMLIEEVERLRKIINDNNIGG
jgi:hypothetical protein